MADQLPQAVLLLLHERITTFEQLEIMLLLRAHPEKEWNAPTLSATTGIPIELTHESLMKLAAGGLLEPSGSGPIAFRFRPRQPDIGEAIDALALAYHEQRALVMSTMSMNAIERIRSGTIRAFADSFVLGKKKDDG